MTQFFGKYRGKVQLNIDPYLTGRLMVTAPAALGDAQVWALPCTPYGGAGVGFVAIPPVGANVWVEFEGGSPEYPIWSGCFWGNNELPSTALSPMIKLLKTDTVTVTLSDAPGIGGVTIETADGAKITMTAQSIEINDGKGATVTLQGPKVSLNGSALEVT
jgi:uncharacterized protein involved in type VI secretion and phage assembly